MLYSVMLLIEIRSYCTYILANYVNRHKTVSFVVIIEFSIPLIKNHYSDIRLFYCYINYFNRIKLYDMTDL